MKKVIFLVTLLFLFISVSSIRSTLSYYIDEVNKNTLFDIANWVIKVNEDDITSENKTFTIDDINLIIPDSSIEGLKVSNEKFAPGTSGNFNILLDLSKVDTSIEYELIIDTSEIDESNIIIESVEVNNQELKLIDDSYKKELLIKDIKNNNQELIIVNFKWLDNEEYDDIKFGNEENKVLSLPIEVNVKQIME